MENPYFRDGGWYWFAEDESEEGPFETREEALMELNIYCKWALEGNDNFTQEEWRHIQQRLVNRIKNLEAEIVELKRAHPAH